MYQLQDDTTRYQGMTINKVPTEYLVAMVEADHKETEEASKELKRRHQVEIPRLAVSQECIDIASRNLYREWTAQRRQAVGDKPAEGLYTWLWRMGLEALADGRRMVNKYHYKGMVFSYQRRLPWPTLTAVSVK